MREILINAGFHLAKTCRCSGRTEKYKKEDIRVDIKPNKQTWKLYKYDKMKAAGIAAQLQESLNTYT